MISNDFSIGTALGVGFLSLVTYKVVSFYSLVRKYPPGPFPLPFVGNIPFLRLKGQHLHDAMQRLSKEYGPVFTVWLGPQPQVFVFDSEACTETLKSKTFAGRPQTILLDHINSRPGSTNIAFGDLSREWEVMRRVTFAAIRRYASSYSLSQHVIRVTDQVIDRIMKNKDSIDVDGQVNTLMLALLSTSAFGIKYDLEDEEFLKIVKTMETQTEEDRIVFFIALSSLMRFVFWPKWRLIMRNMKYFRNLIGLRFKEHEESFQVQETRDFTDSLLWARVQAREEEEEDLIKCIDSWNIRNAVANLFFAGSQTTRTTLSWWFLYSALNQDMQDKIRQEVNSVLPNDEDTPLIEMKEKCPFLLAFTSEVLRMRPVAPFAVPHKALENGIIAGHKIPAGTTVLPSIYHVMQDNSIWKDAGKFDPYRYIDSETGKFIQRPNNYWLPFSTGRRSCIGEKLAMANIFLILCRFFQKTRGFRYEVTNNSLTQEEMLSVDTNKPFFDAKKYQMKLIPV